MRAGRRPGAARSGERGLLHGLSLVLLTFVLFGAIAFFALAKLPLRCVCRDSTTRETTRNGLESTDVRCREVCEDRGGGVPASKAKKLRR